MKKRDIQFIIFFITLSFNAVADINLPGFADSGDLKNQLESAGENVVETITLVVSILSIIGMAIGAGFFSVGNKERGVQFLVGGGVGLTVAGTVFGIAALFV